MVTRLLALVLILSMASIVLVACDSAEAAEPTPQPASPPPPPRAPTVLSLTEEIVCAPHEPGGSGLSVGLRDLAGSGEYTFDPAELTFNVGDTVNFTLTGEAEAHTFTVDDLEIDVSVGAGEELKCSFTFDQPGTFPLICIPHELQGMVGTIRVNS